MLYGLLPKPPDKMASYFNLSFLLLSLIQSILLCIRDSTGERKVFEKCFYDLKREIHCSKWRAIAVLLGGRVGEGKQMHVTGIGPEANDTHLELRLSGRLDC